MNVFKILKDSLDRLERHATDYSLAYKDGYRDAINSIEERIKDNINIRVEDN